MKEIDFKDRVPNNRGRITLTPVSGQPNTFDMERADDPLDEGTPINKALLQSITHSRLTGRFYPVSYSRSVASTETFTVPVLQGLTWGMDSAGLVATSGAYQVTASSKVSDNYKVDKAFDKNYETQWASADGTNHTFTIRLASAIMLNKFKMQLGRTGTSSYTLTVQGSTNGSNWTNIYNTSNYNEPLAEYTVTNPGDYQYYRFSFAFGGSARIYINELEFSNWSVNAYQNTFTADGVPASYDKGQRVMVQIHDIGQFSVVKNTFMGITCNTILQRNKRYELTYNGSTFDAKEV